MEALPSELGWTASQEGNASYAVETDGLTGNQSLRITTEGAEGAPGPIASFSLQVAPGEQGRFILDLRVEDVGPYTQVTVAEVDFGERVLRFHLRNVPEMGALFGQWLLADRASLRWEREIEQPATFQTTRLLELRYDLAARTASVLLEGSPVAQDLPLEEDWRPGLATLRIGAFGYSFPSSSAIFELDNVGFERLTQ